MDFVKRSRTWSAGYGHGRNRYYWSGRCRKVTDIVGWQQALSLRVLSEQTLSEGKGQWAGKGWGWMVHRIIKLERRIGKQMVVGLIACGRRRRLPTGADGCGLLAVDVIEFLRGFQIGG